MYLNLCLPVHVPLVPIRLAKINERELARLEGDGNSHVPLLVGVEIDIIVSEQFGNIYLG